jgi:Domain of unknown function DUF29
MTVGINYQKLYEIDNYLWLKETIKLLKLKQFDQLDLDNLIEELESLGRNDKNAVESLLEQIIRHLLLLQYWQEEKERNLGHWSGEIVNFRNQLKRRLTGTLKNHLAQERLNLYQDALEFVQQKTQFKVNFPMECPYTFEQLLDKNYLPSKE